MMDKKGRNGNCISFQNMFYAILERESPAKAALTLTEVIEMKGPQALGSPVERCCSNHGPWL